MAVFGTDGIRGKFGDEHITPDFFLKLGYAMGAWLGPGKKVLIGKDTRLSGYILESSLEAGLASMGVDVYLTGPLSTPAIAYLTKSLRAQAGIVISASHNPFDDNGIKIFNSQGMKLTSEQQNQLLSQFDKNTPLHTDALGKVYRVSDALGRYIEYVKNQFEFLDLQGVKIGLDCAHGALYQAAPTLFSELNADLAVLGDNPNGYNINKGSGAMHPEAIAQLCQDKSIDLGFSFDGDGDRLLVSYKGKIVPSEYVLLFLYDFFKLTEAYDGGIIGTILANSGLEKFLEKKGISYAQTPVGDRFLAAELEKTSWSLAGEPSGHYIIFHRSSTADALLTSLAIAIGIFKYDMSFDKYYGDCPLQCSLMKSIQCPKPHQVVAEEKFQQYISQLKTQNPQIKVLVRASGTEPKIRVTLESAKEKGLDELFKTIEGFLVENQHFS